MGLRDLVYPPFYRLYERRLGASLSRSKVPRHVGVMCDGNRRWARSAGLMDVSKGHRKGADKIFELLGWCRDAGVEVVTLWLLSTDNLVSRPESEIEPLLGIIEDTVRELVAQNSGGSSRSARLTCCPPNWPTCSRTPTTRPRTTRACKSTSPSATAAAARSPTRSARC